jgi:hypothetical protein
MMECRRYYNKQSATQEVIVVTNGVLLDDGNCMQLRYEGVSILIAAM